MDNRILSKLMFNLLNLINYGFNWLLRIKNVLSNIDSWKFPQLIDAFEYKKMEGDTVKILSWYTVIARTLSV